MKGPRAAIALAVVLLVAALLHGYPAVRLLPGAGITAAGPAALIGLAAAVLMTGCMLAGHLRSHDLLGTVGDVWLGVVFQLFVWTLLAEPVRLVLGLADVAGAGQIAAALTLVVTVVVLAWGIWRALGPIPVTRPEVRIERLHPDLDGLRILQITDTHLSRILGPRWIARVVDQVRFIDADIYCHTGDLADGRTELREAAVSHLAQVQAPHRYYITGNHEYFTDAEHWGRRMSEMGWRFLHNQHEVYRRGDGRLVIAGIDDPTGTSSGLAGHGPNLEKALEGAPEDAAVLLLAHQPKQARGAAGRVDLQLAGHTHGGQMWPFHYLVRADQKYVSGLHRVGDRTQVYVSRGTGFWGPPFRIGAPPEIALITLRSG